MGVCTLARKNLAHKTRVCGICSIIAAASSIDHSVRDAHCISTLLLVAELLDVMLMLQVHLTLVMIDHDTKALIFTILFIDISIGLPLST